MLACLLASSLGGMPLYHRRAHSIHTPTAVAPCDKFV